MKQPKNSIESMMVISEGHFYVDVSSDSGEHSQACIGAGDTPLSAHKAAAKRLTRLLKENDRMIAKLEKGGG